MSTRLSASALSLSFVFLMAFAIGTAAHAQGDNCMSAGTNLDGMDTVPFTSPAVSGGADDINLTACGASFAAGNRDTVACFVPTNACTVNLTCSRSFGTISINVTNSGASCSATPACGSTATGGSGSATVSSLALAAGVEVCVYCDSAPALLTTSITAVSGSCGPLPVELQSFSVESDASDDSSDEPEPREEGEPEEDGSEG